MLLERIEALLVDQDHHPNLWQGKEQGLELSKALMPRKGATARQQTGEAAPTLWLSSLSAVTEGRDSTSSLAMPPLPSW